MGRNISLDNTTVILNSTVIDGWSEDTDAFTIPEIEISTAKRGADGRMVLSSTGNNGGEVVFKLLANSDSVKFMSAIYNQQTQGSNVTLNGTYLNHDTGYSGKLTYGGITKASPAPSLGKGEVGNMVYTMEFEAVTGDFSAANFD